MSLKGGMSATELFDTIDDARKGKKKAIDRLSDYYQKGFLSTEEYNKLLTEYRTNKSRKIKALLCIVLVLSLSVAAVVYHNNAIEDAYNTGYREGYEKGYGFYKKIKDEYVFYHRYAAIVTKAGKKYHRYDCYHIDNRSFYIYNVKTAEAKGYTPCLDCYD